MEQALNECVNVQHQHLRTIDNELIDARDGMRSNFRAGVIEELQKFRYHNVQRPIELCTVQCFGRIFANFLQRTKRTLAHIIVLRVKHFAQGGQQLRPIG